MMDQHLTGNSTRLLKRLIWSYFWLLIVEGALRRWVLPGFAAPLLLVREPVAIAILLLAISKRAFQRSALLWLGLGTALLSFLITMMFAHRNLYVALYGLRIYLLHLPLIFIIWKVFDPADVRQMGRAFCLVSIPMTGLVAAQFFLPQSHLVNIGIGGEGTAGFSGAEDRFRPPGTFSFITGMVQFYSLVGAFIGAFALRAKGNRHWWWIGSALCLAVAVPLSISRSLALGLVITGTCFFLAGVGKKELSGRLLGGVMILGVLILATRYLPGSQEATSAFSSRWSGANDAEGGLVEGVFVDRFLGGLWGALTGARIVPLQGLGLGLGTNAGASISTGARAFLISEGEWGQIVGEMGPILGLVMVGVRLSLAGLIISSALRAWRAGRPLALLLVSVTALWIAQGSWGQPTSLGFAVLGAGLTLAATKRERALTDNQEVLDLQTQVVERPLGRSTFAESLHRT